MADYRRHPRCDNCLARATGQEPSGEYLCDDCPPTPNEEDDE